MEKALEQFKQIAPHILGNVKARLTGSESDEAKLQIIHEEIVKYFAGWQSFFKQYLCFNDNQRRDFSELMYDMVLPLAQNHEAPLNPVYENFVKETGKTGALNFICYQHSRG